VSSNLQGGCVVLVLSIGAFAAAYAISDAAALLSLWVLGAVSLYRAVRRDVSTTPPLSEEAPSQDVFADESVEVERVERGPEGVMFIVHPKRTEVRSGD